MKRGDWGRARGNDVALFKVDELVLEVDELFPKQRSVRSNVDSQIPAGSRKCLVESAESGKLMQIRGALWAVSRAEKGSVDQVGDDGAGARVAAEHGMVYVDHGWTAGATVGHAAGHAAADDPLPRPALGVDVEDATPKGSVGRECDGLVGIDSDFAGSG